MSKNTETTVTAEDLVAQAAAENLVTPTVPAQGEKQDKVVNEDVVTDGSEPDLTLVDGGKKSLKERVESLTEKLKANKKALIGLGAAVGFAALAFAKYAKAQATEVIELTDEDVEDEQPEDDA